jgi:hemerythrin
MPTALLFLTLAPLVALSALAVPAPFVPVPVVLGVLFAVSGLALAWRGLLAPLRRLRMPRTPPCRKRQRLLQRRGRGFAALQERQNRQKTPTPLLREKEENNQDAGEGHEKYSGAITGQGMGRAILDKVTEKLQSLAARLPQETRPEEDAHTRACRAFMAESLENVLGDLTYCAKYLDQMNVFLGNHRYGKKGGTRRAGLLPMVRELLHGVPVIDGQHKLLLSYINRLARNINRAAIRPAAGDSGQSGGYAFTHFNTKKFLRPLRLPGRGKHIRNHREFKQTVAEFRQAVDEARPMWTDTFWNF